MANTNDGGIYRSTDGGTRWTRTSFGDGLPYAPFVSVGGIAAAGTIVIAQEFEGHLFRSTDSGGSWTILASRPTPAADYVPLTSVPGGFYATRSYPGSGGTDTTRLYLSTDNGSTWGSVLTSLSKIYSVVEAGSYRVISTQAGIYRVLKTGGSAQSVSTGIALGWWSLHLTVIDSTLFAHRQEGFSSAVFRSTDLGSTWQDVTGSLPSGSADRSLYVQGSSLYFTGFNGELYRSTDLGTNWSHRSTFISPHQSMAFFGTEILSSGPQGIFWSPDSGASWWFADEGIPCRPLALVQHHSNQLIVTSEVGRLHHTTDQGLSWDTMFRSWLESLRQVVSNGTYVFVRGDYGIYRTNLNQWDDISAALPVSDVLEIDFESLEAFGSVVLIGTNGDGLFRSTNSGTQWTKVNSGGMNSTATVNAVELLGSVVFASTNAGVWKSLDSGATWTAAGVGLESEMVTCFNAVGTALFAGTGTGIFRSTNGGTSWSGVRTTPYVYDMVNSGGALITSSDDGIFATTDLGATWTNRNLGLIYVLDDIELSGGFLYGTSSAGGLWRRSMSEIVTEVDLRAPETPVTFEVSQNYPNPFNPSTSIRFSLPSESGVALTVYDQLGREVGRLVQGTYPAGVHEVVWDAAGASSGLYFYRIVATGSDGVRYVKTKRMILIR